MSSAASLVARREYQMDRMINFMEDGKRIVLAADRAPNAQVAIAGYPYLFNGQDCSWATFFSGREMSRLNAGTAELDRLIDARSGAAGFTYVEVRDDFAGHAVCDSQAWVNNLTFPVDESFHPNRAGNRAYAAAITPALAGPYDYGVVVVRVALHVDQQDAHVAPV